MKKILFALIVIVLLLPSVVFAQTATTTPEAAPTPEPEEVTLESINARLAEIEKRLDVLIIALVDLEEVKAKIAASSQPGNGEVNNNLELGKGIFRVPDDMKYGVWKYQSSDGKSDCFIKTHSDVSTNFDSIIDIQSSPSGYITINDRVKLVDVGSISLGDCTIKWVSEK